MPGIILGVGNLAVNIRTHGSLQDSIGVAVYKVTCQGIWAEDRWYNRTLFLSLLDTTPGKRTGSRYLNHLRKAHARFQGLQEPLN